MYWVQLHIRYIAYYPNSVIITSRIKILFVKTGDKIPYLQKIQNSIKIMTPLCIYASEIGSLIGCNVFETASDAMEIVILRHCTEKVNRSFLSKQQKVQKSYEGDLKIQEILKVPCLTNTEQQKQTAEVVKLETSRVKELEGEIKSLHYFNTDTADEVSNFPATSTAGAGTEGATTSADTSNAVTNDNPRITADTDPAAISNIAASTVNLAAEAVAADGTNDTKVTTTPSDVRHNSEGLTADYKQLHNDQQNVKKRKLEETCILVHQVTKRAMKEINCSIGKYVEESFVHKDDIQLTQQSFTKFLGGITDVKLYGKVDGFDQTKQQVIEIKTRKNRLWRRLWPSEMIQILCYMFISGTTSTRFIEVYGNTKYEQDYRFNLDKWNDIETKLVSVCKQIRARLE